MRRFERFQALVVKFRRAQRPADATTYDEQRLAALRAASGQRKDRT